MFTIFFTKQYKYLQTYLYTNKFVKFCKKKCLEKCWIIIVTMTIWFRLVMGDALIKWYINDVVDEFI